MAKYGVTPAALAEIVDVGFSGNGGGHYHTAFDDFGMVERYLDPGFVGHELAGGFFATLLADLADGLHEAQRAAQVGAAPLVLGAQLVRQVGVLEEGQVPLLGVVQVGEAAIDQ